MKVLSLDLSTTCTGWAFMETSTEKLLAYGTLKPKTYAKLGYPWQQLVKMQDLAEQLMGIIVDDGYYPDLIIIEEINRGKSRLTQKTLDGLHYIILDAIHLTDIPVRFFDSDGKEGWRSAQGLKLQLSDADKEYNKKAKRFNKKLPKGTRGKKLVVSKKTLACRFVNEHYGLDLIENIAGGADIADAIGLAHFYIHIVAKGENNEK